MPATTTSTTTKGARTRERLLAAAREALVEGEGEFAFGDVAKRAGVSAGAPYRHFESKSDLMVAIVERFFDAFEETAYRPTFEDLADDWWSREQIRIERMVEFVYAEPIGPQILRGVSGDAKVAHALRQRLDRQSKGAASNVALGQRLGVVSADIDPELTGALLMGGIYQALSVAVRGRRRGKKRLIRELRAFMARVLELEVPDA